MLFQRRRYQQERGVRSAAKGAIHHRPSSLLMPDEAISCQRVQRCANGVSGDSQILRQDALGRQKAPGRIHPRENPRPDRRCYLPGFAPRIQHVERPLCSRDDTTGLQEWTIGIVSCHRPRCQEEERPARDSEMRQIGAAALALLGGASTPCLAPASRPQMNGPEAGLSMPARYTRGRCSPARYPAAPGRRYGRIAVCR